MSAIHAPKPGRPERTKEIPGDYSAKFVINRNKYNRAESDPYPVNTCTFKPDYLNITAKPPPAGDGKVRDLIKNEAPPFPR
ncbi:MAG: hypothetical protein HY897_21895, partial [Deltaproteobacteria bacterium]|nr:hypothetical protein [Deltaproteobacteria bacterium]